MAEKVTVMVLKVDLQCSCCYKKVKKILCKFPQIRDQVYNEKANTVTIKVVCCNPEKIRDKLCCKGSKVIKSIEIIEPPKEPEKPQKTGKPPPVEKPEEASKPAPAPPQPEPVPFPVCGYPPTFPGRTCCGPCSQGYGGGPCYHGYGVAPPPPPRPCYDGYYRYEYGYGPRKGCRASRCDYYFSDANPQGCSIM